MASVTVSPLASSAEERVSGATYLLVAYLFFLVSRVFEALTIVVIHRNLFLMLLLTFASLIAILFTGGLGRALRSTPGILLVAITVWYWLGLPFSTWKGGTLNILMNNWMKSVPIFFVVAGLMSDFSSVQKAMKACGFAIVIAGISIHFTGSSTGGRLEGIGSFANSNELAFHFLLGLIFAVYWITTSGWGMKIVAALGALNCLLQVAKTGSRGGLIVIGMLLLFAIYRASMANRIKLIAATAIVAVAGISAASQESLDRYRTLFGDSGSTDAFGSAELSRESREYHLRQSIELTLRYPIFGVGLGNFLPMSAGLSEEKGEAAAWRQTHNAYTQVSSESGFPGIFLYLGIIGVCWKILLDLDKKAKEKGNEDVRKVVFALICAMATFTISGAFDSVAYGFYLPMLAGLVVGVQNAALPLLEKETSRAFDEPSLVPVGAGRGLAPAYQTSGQSVAARAPLPPRNPYKFGRHRNTPNERL